MTADRCVVEYGVLWWEDDKVEPARDGHDAGRKLAFGGGQGVVVKRVVKTQWTEWWTA